MKVTNYDDYLASLKNHSETFDRKTDDIVLDIIQNVRKNGDKAVFDYAKKFDKVELTSLIVSKEEIAEAKKNVSDEFISAMERAAENIQDFHDKQVEQSWYFNKPNGVMLGQQVTALDRVGIYVPGGKAAYPSTVLMNALPAKIAGVKEIYMTTPPQTDGKINPHVLYAANLAGIDTIYKIGGAQAIAAFAYGTESVRPVDKIVGPGNVFVARAKKWVYGDVAIDMIAGPSEICVVADETAPPEFIAADLLSQAEHDEKARAICITTSDSLAKAIKSEVTKQLEQLDRSEIARISIDHHGVIIVVDELSEAFELVNEIAPEHLQLMFNNASE
ncbi:MAG TPA: histidinol dehydrogenase, partial [Pseudogracilibacillus sp.]|nr:histidinol dehydrogenase [Pseudogracilibacillus sp.]